MPIALPPRLRALTANAQDHLVIAQVFAGGAVVMALELLGSRLLAPRFGNTLYVWGSLIGVVMTALALGAYVGGRRADARPDADALARLVFLAGLATLAVPVFSRFVLDVLEAQGLGLEMGPLVATAVLIAPATFLLGMATPFAIRLTAPAMTRLGNTAGRVSAVSTTGSIAGTFLTVFVFVPRYTVPVLITAAGVVLVTLAIAGMRGRVGALVVVGLLLAVSPAGGDLAMRFMTDAGHNLAYETLYETDSPYHHVRVLESRAASEKGYERVLLVDDLRHSATYTERPNETSTRYVDYFHLAPALNPNASRALFVGGGGYSGPKQFLAAYPNMTVDVVEIDPVIVRVAEKWFFAPMDDPRLTTFTEDGRRHLAQADTRYDVVVLDAYSRTYVPFHLMTAEFFFELHDRLAPGGVVIMNLIASTEGAASDVLKAEVKTMRQAFTDVYVFPVGGARGVFAQNIMIVATDGHPDLSREEILEHARAASGPHAPDLPDHAGHLLEDVDTFGAPILRDDFAPVEMLINPVTRAPFARE